MIELIGIQKSFGEHKVLHDVNLTIHAGDIFGVIGKSGAGKSTLLRCINLLENPDAGEVKIDGRSLLSLSASELSKARHKIGMVFQYFNLLNSKTVFENIALPLRLQGQNISMIQARVRELLSLIGLEDKAQVYPEELSGGQKQRVAIARALASKPSILLCDEATSALDPETTQSILNLLKKINVIYGITVVLITHDMGVVKRLCHRIALMGEGRILENMSLADAFKYPQSQACQMLYQEVSPRLPTCLLSKISETHSLRPVLRLLFQGDAATVPFISTISQEMSLSINILLANIDRFDTVTCGVLIIELFADSQKLRDFILRCQQANLHVEVLGYVSTSLD